MIFAEYIEPIGLLIVLGILGLQFLLDAMTGEINVN